MIRCRSFLIFALLLIMQQELLPQAFASAVKQRSSSVNDRFTQAEAAFRVNNLAVAEQVYTEIVARQPGHVKARFRLGQVLTLLGKSQQALPHLEELLRQNPGHVTGRCFLARVLADIGRVQEATGHLEWILQVQPEHEEARTMLTQIRADAPSGTSSGSVGQRAGNVTHEGFEPMPSTVNASVDGSMGQIAPKGPQPIMLGQGTVPPSAD
ncbi:MAG TPA: tetratricopeptide repeat protein, partial [Candidatus Ozemobacteraceae bacterium]|nr:tetratricopeptide repeat protein [Candidatus Ozemobacteraceae bacterium]